MARARTLTLKTKVEVTGAKELDSLGKKFQRAGAAATVGLTVPILALGKAMFDAAEEADRAERKLINTFDSMGAAAWTTTDAIKAQAKELQSLTTFGDEEILELQSTLLTFGQIGEQSFDRATSAALDMAAFFGTDLQSAAVQVGKALNDPLKGLTALSRVGVSFTNEQKELIRTLTLSGETAKAQGIILEELERQFGGTAEALAGTAGGQLKQAFNEVGEALEEFGGIIAPVIGDIASGVKDFAKFLGDLNPETKKFVVQAGLLLAVLGPLLGIVGSILRPISLLWRIFASPAPAAGMAGTTAAAGGLRAAITGLLGPVGLAVTALAGLTAIGENLHRELAPVEHEFNEVASKVGMSRVQIEGEVNRLAQSLGVSADEIRVQLTEALGGGATWDEAVAGLQGVAEEFETEADRIPAAVAHAAEEVREEGKRIPRELSTVIGNQARVVRTAADTALATPLVEALLGGKEEAERIAEETPGAIAQAMLDNQFSVEDAAASLTQTAADALHPMIEMAQIQGFLSSKQLAAGLASGVPATRQRALELKQAAEQRLAELSGAALFWGENAGKSYAAGIINALGVVRDAGRQLGGALASQVRIESEPPDPNSPLAGITKWGVNLAHTYAEGIVSGLRAVSSAAGALAGAAVPGTPALASVGASPAAPGAGVINNFYITFSGEAPATRNPEEIVSQLQRLSPLIGGKLAPGW